MPSETRNSSRLQGALCVLVLLLCVLVTRPFVEMGVNDDWSFIRTAQVMAQTGHIAYNGWAAMILGWQVMLGALFIKLFGFSFTIVRLPIFVLGLFTAYLLQRVLVRFGLQAWNAVLLTLTLVLSPLFLPMAFSFMSDVSGLFCILFCIYGCQRALQAESTSASLRWLYFAAIVNILDGTVRQIVWLGVLVMVPCTAWLIRRRKAMLLHGAGLWLLGVASVLTCTHWYAQQPYSANEKLIDGTLNSAAISFLLWNLLKAFLSLLFFTLPVLILFPLQLWRLGRKIAIRAFSFIGLAIALTLPFVYLQFKATHSLNAVLFPWLVNIFTTRGILQFGTMVGLQPIILHIPLRAFLTLLTLISGLSCAACVLFTQNASTRDFDNDIQAGILSWHQTILLLIPFSLAYIILLMPRAAFHTLFDRYLLPLVLVLGVFALRSLQEHARRPVWLLGWATLLVLTLYTVAGTHDVYELDRARLTAANEVTSSGVARAAVDGGFEYDGWTQVTIAGYVNDPHITIPSGAYKLQPKDDNPCDYAFRPYTPAIQPAYVLSFDPTSCFEPSRFPPVTYTMWLAPHHRSIFIQRVP